MLPDKIHFGVIVEGHKAEMHEAPFPEVGPDDIVIKMATCNICTTDYQQWMGLRDHQGFPMAGGHEFSGTIIHKGENVLDDFEMGMQVAVMHKFCGKCYNCRIGHQGDCTNKGAHGPGPDGYYGQKGFADYYVVDQMFVVPVDNDVPPAEAGFLEAGFHGGAVHQEGAHSAHGGRRRHRCRHDGPCQRTGCQSMGRTRDHFGGFAEENPACQRNGGSVRLSTRRAPIRWKK